jgi:hypothetical protein
LMTTPVTRRPNEASPNSFAMTSNMDVSSNQ